VRSNKLFFHFFLSVLNKPANVIDYVSVWTFNSLYRKILIDWIGFIGIFIWPSYYPLAIVYE
jgi:hypothetical protein